MTTPHAFKQHIVDGLKELQKKLPLNSHVVFVGVADGRLNWDAMHKKQHPLGTTYPLFYNFLSCVNVNPCQTWLNDNETIRDQTTAHAEVLNKVYGEIMKEYKFPNFDMHYLANPGANIHREFERQHKDRAILVEPVDGFHPSQEMQGLLFFYSSFFF